MADVAAVGGGDVENANNGSERKENLSNSVTEAETGQGVQKDGDIQRNKEREERFRLARVRQKEEQRRKMEELREAMARAEEFRKKQEEERRRKIEEMRKREEEHRAIVEERRKRLHDEENERKQAILRRTAEREAKLGQAKSRKMYNSATSGTLVALRGAASAQNISFRPPKAGPGTHIANSVRDIRSSSILQQDKTGEQDFVVSAAPPVARMKRFSASTGHLLKNSKTGSEDGNILDDQLSSDGSKLEADIVLHPLGCGKGYQSDGTLSSTGRSPSHHRPHSTAGRLPNYTCDTISSQLRVGRSKEKPNVSSCAVVCSRFRSVSPTKNGRARSTGSARKSRADIQKVFDQLATPSSKSPTEAAGTRHCHSDKTAPAVNPARRTRSVLSRPSKLLASPVSSPVVSATLPRGGKASPLKPLTHVVAAKPSKSTTPPGNAPFLSKGGMPSPPKTITPRSLPKEPKPIKDVTSNKSITSSKVKALHDQVNQDQIIDNNKQTETAETKEAKLIEQTDIALPAPSESVSSSEKADTMKKSVTEEDEYKLKLAEKRRLAREKAEREAEEERQRLEKERLEEEERIRREEEEERRREEEELRLAEEAARHEAERFQKAIEEEERRRRDEEERLEAEKKEKLEAEQRAQEEAERKEKERAEKAKREETERLERKKRLEMIMKRVKPEEAVAAKPESAAISVVKPVQESGTVEPTDEMEKMEPALTEPPLMAQPTETALPDSTVSVDSSPSNLPVIPTLLPAAPIVSTDPVDKSTSQFRSPLLRQMLGNKMKAKVDATSEAASPKGAVADDTAPTEKTAESEVLTEQLLAVSSSDGKQSEGTSVSNLDIQVTEEEESAQTETTTRGIADVQVLKSSNDNERKSVIPLVKEECNEDDDDASCDILISTDNERFEKKAITDTESKEEETGKIVETAASRSDYALEGSNNGASMSESLLYNTVKENDEKESISTFETSQLQGADPVEIAEQHEASGSLCFPEEMNVAGVLLPSGIGASNGESHRVNLSDSLLLDSSLPEVSSGSSLAVNSLNNLETGASSPLHSLSEDSEIKENVLDLRDDSGIDQLIDLSASDALALDRQSWNQSELPSQSTPSPVGVPSMAFEDNSNIQLKSVNGEFPLPAVKI